MNQTEGIANTRLPKPTLGAADQETSQIRVGPGTVLLLAVWIGLLTGFLDLGLLVVNKRSISGDFVRLGSDFTWVIPAAVTILMLAPAL